MVSETKIFSCYSYYNPLGDNDGPLGMANLDPRGMVGRIYKGDDCYKQNIKALGLMVSKKKIFFMFFLL